MARATVRPSPGSKDAGSDGSERRILYVQFTNPAAYPPLEHSARLFADAGWDVMFLGTGALGADRLEFRPHRRIQVKRMRFVPGGWRQKVRYVGFLLWVTGWALRWRPRWIYASEWLACPVALVLRILLNANVIYHEHDSPASGNGSLFERAMLATRTTLARRARACVLPNQRRAEMFAHNVVGGAAVMCVWNCPTRDEAISPRAVRRESGDLWVLYHGSIVPARLPISVLKALTLVSDAVKLRIVGYETVGHRGYVEELRATAAALAITPRVDFVGAVRTREELLTWCRRCDVGIAFMPRRSQDINEQNMVGASNKPFDYMASGLALLVSDLPGWRATFVGNGYGLACDSDDWRSIGDALQWFLNHPAETHRMGERGRRKVLSDWNYETQFAPILNTIVAVAHPSDVPKGQVCVEAAVQHSVGEARHANMMRVDGEGFKHGSSRLPEDPDR